MEYRQLDKLNIKTSLLGFGCMRFPTLEDGSINEAEAEKMIDHAISQGVNYIDTAYPYHNGDSEPFVGKVLKKYNRKDFYLATKLPVWNIEKFEDVERIFNEQLTRLDVEYVDFYLLHALDKTKWQKVLDLGIIPYCEKLKAEGKIKYLGFSFHDDYEVFEEIINYRQWDFCQIQLNYIDTDIQAGLKGYELAKSKDIPMVIMEPIKGGSLASLPEDIEKMFKSHDSQASLSSWALRWVGSLDNIKVILSGMSTFEQLEDNLNTFNYFKALDDTEQALVEQVASTIKSRTKNGCTGCAYCMPCPFGINIPKNFRIWNDYAMYGNTEVTKKRYYKELKDNERAEFCKKCGKCEKMCPQAIKIREDLKRVVEDMPKC